MNLSEFKAWFEGFTENLDGPPGQKAWDKIQAKVKDIKVDPTPWPIFVELYHRYWPQPATYPWNPYWVNYTTGSLSGGDTKTLAGAAVCNNLGTQNYTAKGVAGIGSQMVAYNAQDAFRDLGRMEAGEA